jgi:hypothetical protein
MSGYNIPSPLQEEYAYPVFLPTSPNAYAIIYGYRTRAVNPMVLCTWCHRKFAAGSYAMIVSNVTHTVRVHHLDCDREFLNSQAVERCPNTFDL